MSDPASPLMHQVDPAQLAAAVAAIERQSSTAPPPAEPGQAAPETATGAPALTMPASTDPAAVPPQGGAAAPQQGEQPPAATPAPAAPEEDRFTRVYASLTELERENRQLKAQLRGGGNLEGIKTKPVKERLQALGLDFDTVFDAWTSDLASGSTSLLPTPAGSPTLPQAQPGASPEVQALLGEIKALRDQVSSLEGRTVAEKEAARKAEIETTGRNFIAAKASEAPDRWQYLLARKDRGSLDLALEIGSEMYRLSGGIQPQVETVLDAAEAHLQEEAKSWALGTGGAAIQQTPSQPVQARPTQAPAPTPTGGDDTPTPRDLTEEERLQKAAGLLKERLSARERARGAG